MCNIHPGQCWPQTGNKLSYYFQLVFLICVDDRCPPKLVLHIHSTVSYDWDHLLGYWGQTAD